MNEDEKKAAVAFAQEQYPVQDESDPIPRHFARWAVQRGFTAGIEYERERILAALKDKAMLRGVREMEHWKCFSYHDIESMMGILPLVPTDKVKK